MKTLIPESVRAQYAIDFIRAAQTDRYFAFVGDHIPNPSDQQSSEIVSSTKTLVDTFTNLIGGKTLSSNDMVLAVPKVMWNSGTVYNDYSDLENRSCHAAIESGANVHVYKCLDNNNGSPSTAAPSGTDALPITTVDGYVWRYLYSVSTVLFDKFATRDIMPFVANTVNQNAAVSQSIDVVKIVNGGVGYTNYTSGQFRAGDVLSSSQFKLVENASNVTNLFKGCVVKITNPDSPVTGQYRRVTAYTVVGSTKTITVSPAFSTTPVAGDTFDIYPEVVISTSNPSAQVASARAIINPLQADSVSEVEILNSGALHRDATAVVAADSSVPVVVPAVLRPIVGPIGGHGRNPLAEIGSASVCVSATLGSSDLTMPLTDQEFRQFGLLKNPRYNNVTLTTSSISGPGFTVGEEVVQVIPGSQLATQGTLSGNQLSSSGASLLNSARPGDTIDVVGTGGRRLVTVGSIADGIATLVEPSNINITNATLTLVRPVANGTVKTVSAGSIVVDQVSTTVSAVSENVVYGLTSGTVKTVAAVALPRSRQVGKFIQTVIVDGTVTSGSFTYDEKVTQTNGSGYVFATETNNGVTTVYLTNITGTIGTGTLTGQSSGATMNITTKYEGDLAADQGQFVYIQNVAPISMVTGRDITFKVVLEF